MGAHLRRGTRRLVVGHTIYVDVVVGVKVVVDAVAVDVRGDDGDVGAAAPLQLSPLLPPTTSPLRGCQAVSLCAMCIAKMLVLGRV